MTSKYLKMSDLEFKNGQKSPEKYSKGRAEYAGYEYSPDIPSQMVMGSPGGVSAIHHHWSHGLYSYGGGTKGIHGADLPRYPQGAYGNIYDGGVTAMDVYGMGHPEEEFLSSNMTTGSIRENYTPVGTTRIDINGLGISESHDGKTSIPFKELLYFFVISILLAVSYYYWTHGLDEYIGKYMKMTANSKIFLALVTTLILIIIVSIFGLHISTS